MRWLFADPPEPRSAWSIIRWWEVRRIAYNLIVGGVGLLSLAAFLGLIGLCGHLEPGEDAFEPIALFVGVVAANICYTAGWVTEVFLLRRNPSGPSAAPQLLGSGLVFSLFVVLLPALLWAITCVTRAFGG